MRQLKKVFFKLIKSSKKIKHIIEKYNIGSFEFRMKLGALRRNHYAYICFNAAVLGKKLGYKKISVIEYGVAEGHGLLSLEAYSSEIEKIVDIEIDVYGFDTGSGLPKPTDYRDLQYHWKEGFFSKNEKELNKKIKKAKLIIGDIEQTSKSFLNEYKPAPIGAVIHDFDFYSSTKKALNMMKENSEFFLPRVFSYFDDIIGGEIELYNDFTGERLAINEFNSENRDIKISNAYHLISRPKLNWYDQIRIIHFFKHKKYNSFISDEAQLPV
jgi:hypothetical protein